MMGIRRVVQWLHEYAQLVMFVVQLLSVIVAVVVSVVVAVVVVDVAIDVCLCDGIDVIHSATTAVRVGKVHEMACPSPFCKD